MNKRQNSMIIFLISKILSPFMMIFGLYVIFHGHYSPGGGFQGGALLAASIIILRLVTGNEIYHLHFPKNLGVICGGIGTAIYALTGFISLLYDKNFLDYSGLKFLAVSDAWKRFYGILFVEIGVGLAVMGVLVAIFDSLLAGDTNES